MADCDGTCQVHGTFEKALLAAVESGSKSVKDALETMFRDLNRRLDESLADRLRLHDRLDVQAQQLAALEANIKAMVAAGHPLRRAEDPPPPPEADNRVPALPRWVAAGMASAIALAGIALLMLGLLIKDPALLKTLLKALGVVQ